MNSSSLSSGKDVCVLFVGLTCLCLIFNFLLFAFSSTYDEELSIPMPHCYIIFICEKRSNIFAMVFVFMRVRVGLGLGLGLVM